MKVFRKKTADTTDETEESPYSEQVAQHFTYTLRSICAQKPVQHLVAAHFNYPHFWASAILKKALGYT